MGAGRRQITAWTGSLGLALLLACAALLAIGSSASALTLGVGWSGVPSYNNPEMSLVAKSGASTFRVPFGGLDDGLVEAAARSGITIHAEVSSGVSSLPLGEARTNFINAVRSAVERYGYEGTFWRERESLPYRPVTTWEVWNEPNLHGIGPGEYGVFLSEVASAIQTASQGKAGRSTNVISGGLYAQGNQTQFDEALDYLSRMYSKFGANKDVTGVAIHPYELFPNTFREPSPGVQYNRINAFRYAVERFHGKLEELAQVYGTPQKSLWITEAGWPAEHQASVGESQQAVLLREAIDFVRNHETSLNVKEFLWYNFRDSTDQAETWFNWCGLRAHDGHFRQAWTAFQEKAGVPPVVPQAPSVGTNGAIDIHSFHAYLTGAVDPRGLPTAYHFDYGTSTAYGSSTPFENAGSTEGGVAEGATITTQPETIYHFRLVATNAVGTSYGNDQTFYSSPAGVFYSDAPNNNMMSRWESSSSGWQQEYLVGDQIAAGTSPATLNVNGTPHVLFVDASDNNTITDWSWNPSTGWQQTFLFGHPVAKGTSPEAIMLNGTPHVLFVDASDNNTITDWSWNPSTGWQQTFLFGHHVAPGTSPSAMVNNGVLQVFYNDASDNNTVSYWNYSPTSGWQQTFLFGHPIAAGSSPAAMMNNGIPQVYYVDAGNENTITAWTWNPSTGWQQAPLWGHHVLAGTSPSAVMVGTTPHIFFVDASDNNTITDWSWNPSTGWQQTFLFGHPAASGTSPAAVVDNGTPHIFFVDASDNNTITDWSWNPSTGWQQTFLFGHAVSANSSAAGF
jgi:hypothetical protein